METVRGRTGKPPRDTQPTAPVGGRMAAAVLCELKRLGVRLSQPGGMQAVAVVAADGRLVAGNRPLFELLGCNGNDLLGTQWSRIMPSWKINQDLGIPYHLDACLHPPRCCKRKTTVTAQASIRPLKDGDSVVAHTVLLTLPTRSSA